MYFCNATTILLPQNDTLHQIFSQTWSRSCESSSSFFHVSQQFRKIQYSPFASQFLFCTFILTSAFSLQISSLCSRRIPYFPPRKQILASDFSTVFSTSLVDNRSTHCASVDPITRTNWSYSRTPDAPNECFNPTNLRSRRGFPGKISRIYCRCSR